MLPYKNNFYNLKGLIIYSITALILSIVGYGFVHNPEAFLKWLIYTLVLFSITWNWSITLLFDYFYEEKYDYGFVRNTPARRNRFNGKIEILLWKAGEHGHKLDYYHSVGSDWERFFTKEPTGE